jgi:hypothetical protein
MKEIAIQVNDDQKAALLAELLSSLDFVSALKVNDTSVEDYEGEEEDSIFYHDPRQPLMLEEEKKFVAMHEQLVSQYLGQYIAMHQGQVVDCDPDELTLVERIRLNYPDEIILVREVQKALPPPLFFRSPHLVKNA